MEVDPAAGTQIYASGSGDLFGIAMAPSGDGFYYVEDEVKFRTP